MRGLRRGDEAVCADLERYKDAALRQVEHEHTGLSEASRADKGNASAVRHGKESTVTQVWSYETGCLD